MAKYKQIQDEWDKSLSLGATVLRCSAQSIDW